MPKYNHSYFEEDGILYEHWSNRSGTSHTYVEIEPEWDDNDDADEGYSACGNPAYPKCKTSCPLFDD